MEESEIENAVMAYLKRKGFRQTELALQEEQRKTSSSAAKTDPEIAKQIIAYAELDNGPVRYREEYSRLRTWTYNSLDVHKHELLRVLYPVFIHCFMDLVAKGHSQEARSFFQSFREDHEPSHLRDLQKLEGVLSPHHLEEMEFAHCLRQNKVTMKLCKYSYELLLQHLHKTESMVMLGVINERINLQVPPGQPCSNSEEVEVVALTGSSQEAVEQINQKEIHWGVLEDSLEERLEKEILAAEAEKAEAEDKEGHGEESKKKAGEGGKSGGPNKKMKKDKLTGTTGKGVRTEANVVSSAPRVKAELTMPTISMEVERSALEDLRNRARLSSSALPSVSFYTFVNTHYSLNCASISHDGGLVVGGFSDSSLKVWNMSKMGEQHGEVADGQNEHSAGLDVGKRSYTLLQGHAGPVYAANFSPEGEYILSASADNTVRLWSSKLNANLVCYKGHNYAVWDVQFSPVGHYFVSASHDRTARVWSMDRIHPLRIMAGHLSDVDCVQWHANCNYIATGSSDKTVRLWDVQTGECVRMFVGHHGMVLSIAMSPDGRYMASGDENGTIRMWDLSSGRCITPLTGHTSCIWTLAFSCEGSLLASGSADCTVKLWDVNASSRTPRMEEKAASAQRLRLLKALPTKSTPVHALRFSRRNLLFAAGAFTKSP
ncbi:transcription initiation factor TFIID subunit 5 isoform X2 [Cryptomeria japonica]|uniref:transcription initiation factor TFIID subunit 5 isoform X2 n=1 Tax=Cryptomeria japonica TaxID=3369 RepID=UPI0025AC9F18|nr:transcription initiation factor TFIID subunit 5 isoform X2 [Cryptomeria japonica]